MILKDKIMRVMINITTLELYLTQGKTLWSRHYCSIQPLTFGPLLRTWPKVCLPLHRPAGPRQASAAPEEALQFRIRALFVCIWITSPSDLRSKKLCQGPLETRKFQHQSLAKIRPSKCKLILEDNVTSGTYQWDLLCFSSKARIPIGKLAQCFV